MTTLPGQNPVIELQPGQKLTATAPTGQRLTTSISKTRLTAAITASGTSVDPTPTPPPTGGNVVQFTPAMSMAQLVAMCADSSVDVVEMASGTYPNWKKVDLLTSRTTPVLVRPAVGAVVIFDGAGTSPTGNDPVFNFGHYTSSPLCRGIRFDSAGTGGRFRFQNYLLGQTGLVDTFYAQDCGFSGVDAVNIRGSGSNSTTHLVYVSSDGSGHRAANLTFNDWSCHLTDGVHILNGLQTYHKPSADGVTAKDWDISGLHVAAYLWDDPTGVLIDGWKVDDCQRPFSSPSAYSTAKGIIQGCTVTNSGASDLTNPGIVLGPNVGI